VRNLLVVGGTGYLGKNIIIDLGAEYDNVYVIFTSPPDELINSNSTYVKLDLFEKDWNDKLVDCLADQFDVIITAWPSLTDYGHDIHFDFARVIVEFFSWILDYFPRKIYISGTCFEYESIQGEVSVNDRLLGRNNYAKSKVIAYKGFLKAYQRNESNCTSILYQRIWYLYGRENSPRSLLAKIDTMSHLGRQNNKLQIINLESSGEQYLDYVHIDYIIAEIRSFLKVSPSGKSFIVSNGCSAKPVRLKEFIAEYLAANEINNLSLNWSSDENLKIQKFYGSKKKMVFK
jgi:nucleoside-diphosphate-sugar epimerase